MTIIERLLGLHPPIPPRELMRRFHKRATEDFLARQRKRERQRRRERKRFEGSLTEHGMTVRALLRDAEIRMQREYRWTAAEEPTL